LVVKRIGLLLLSALLCGQLQAAITVDEGYIRGLPPGQKTTAAFMRLHNSSSQSIRIIGVTSPAAQRAEFHRSSHSGDMMSMEHLEAIAVPAGEVVVLKPGAMHLMLINLTAPLRDGDSAPLTLQLEGGEQLTVILPVRSVLNEHRY
jgi:copper(I)-binding protein